MKKILTVGIITAMLFSLSLTISCNKKSPSTSDSDSSIPENTVPSSGSHKSKDVTVEIRAAWWGDTNRHALYKKIIDKFVDAYPHIKVITAPTSWGDYWDKIQVQSAGGNAPDFMGMHQQYASDYVRRGILEPLDDFISDGVISTDGWTKSTLATGTIDGVTYMIPMGVAFTSCFVNEGAIKELGLESPPFDWSWDDLMSWGKEARTALDSAGKTDSWVFVDGSTNLNSWRYFVRQRGHEIYNEDGTIGFTVEDVEKWWTMFNKFREAGIVPDSATSTEYSNAALEDSLFSRDKVLINVVPINQYQLYCTTFPDKTVSIIRNPTAGSYGDSVGEFPEGAHFAISAKTSKKKKLAAAQLLNFWVNTKEGLSLFGLDQGVPGNLDLADAYSKNLDKYQLKIQEFVTTLSDIATPTILPPSGATEVDSIFKSLGEEVQFGHKHPKAGAQEFYDKVVSILSKNKN